MNVVANDSEIISGKGEYILGIECHGKELKYESAVNGHSFALVC